MPNTAPRLAKGRLTIQRTGEFREFSLNPSEVKDTKSVEFPDFQLPLGSAVPRGGTGSSRTISFQLSLDGDVGYRSRRAISRPLVPDGSLSPGAQDEGVTISKSIADEINWYEQYLYPTREAGEYGFTVVLFTFGPRYNAIPCFVTKCDITITHFLADLTPSKGTIDLALKVVVNEQIARRSVYSRSPTRNF